MSIDTCLKKMLKFANKGLWKRSKEVVKQMKHELFFNKAAQDPQKPGQNSGQIFKNRTISGNPYYLVLFEIVLYRGLY